MQAAFSVAAPYLSAFADTALKTAASTLGKAAVDGVVKSFKDSPKPKNPDDILNQAEKLGIDMNDLANAAIRRSKNTGDLYQQMTLYAQPNSFNASQGLIQNYKSTF